MLRGIRNLGRVTALLVFGSSLLCAQEKGIGVDFKLRVASGYNYDQLNSNAFGFGVNLRYGFDWGTLNGELGYYYKPGRQYRAGYGTPADPNVPADPAYSVDSRKNSLTQINARFSYERAIDKDWSWQAGLQVGRAKFRHEYIGDVADTGWSTFEDTYNGTPTKRTYTASPFAGVTYHINKDSAFEFNIMFLSYTAIDFQHTPGAAIIEGDPSVPGSHLVYAGDRLDQQKRNSPHFEIGYTFRF